jgi:hypothetical protein
VGLIFLGMVWLQASGCVGPWAKQETFISRWQGEYQGRLEVRPLGEATDSVVSTGSLEIRASESHLLVHCRSLEDTVAARFQIAFYRLRASSQLSGTYRVGKGKDAEKVVYDLRREQGGVNGSIEVFDGSQENPRLRLELHEFNLHSAGDNKADGL